MMGEARRTKFFFASLRLKNVNRKERRERKENRRRGCQWCGEALETGFCSHLPE